MAKSLFDLVISSFLKYIYIYIVGKADSKNVHEMYYNIHDNIHYERACGINLLVGNTIGN